MGTKDLKRTIYKIKVVKWEKWNSSLKKGHKCILLSTGFLSDPKVRSQSLSGRLLFLSCLLLAGESLSSEFTVTHESLVYESGVKSESLQSQLDQLQSFQLVTYEKTEPLLDKIGKERKRKDRIGKDFQAGFKSPVEISKILNLKIWDAYREEYLTKYHVEPTRNASVNSKISQLAKRLGDDGPDIVRFFVHHPDSFYVKSMHAIGLCLRDAESLATQWRKGRAITTTDIRNYERNQNYQQIIEEINKGGI